MKHSISTSKQNKVLGQIEKGAKADGALKLMMVIAVVIGSVSEEVEIKKSRMLPCSHHTRQKTYCLKHDTRQYCNFKVYVDLYIQVP